MLPPRRSMSFLPMRSSSRRNLTLIAPCVYLIHHRADVYEDPGEFVPERGHYWDTKHGRAVALAKMLVGAVTGTTLDDSIQGRLTV